MLVHHGGAAGRASPPSTTSSSSTPKSGQPRPLHLPVRLFLANDWLTAAAEPHFLCTRRACFGKNRTARCRRPLLAAPGRDMRSLAHLEREIPPDHARCPHRPCCCALATFVRQANPGRIPAALRHRYRARAATTGIVGCALVRAVVPTTAAAMARAMLLLLPVAAAAVADAVVGAAAVTAATTAAAAASCRSRVWRACL